MIWYTNGLLAPANSNRIYFLMRDCSAWLILKHQIFKRFFRFQPCELDPGFGENLFKAVDMFNHCRELHSSVTVNDFMQRICNRVLLVALQPFKAKGGGILTT